MSRALRIAGAALAVSCLGWHASRYLPFFADDGFVSLRYAARLLAGKGLTFNDGEWVEGYSNLLWVLGVAALGAIGVDLVAAARALGFVGMSTALALVAAAPRDDRPVPGAAAAVALATTGPLAVWSIGGLEQGLLAGLLVGAVIATWPLLDGSSAPRRALLPGAPFALLCLTRPDGPIFGVAAAAVVLGARRDRRGAQVAAALLALPLAAVLGQLAFRLATYGEWVPNTAHVKLDPSVRRLGMGARYLARGLTATWPLTIAALAALGAAADPGRRWRVGLASVLAGAWSGYVVAIGGDIFSAHRHLVPILVLEGLLVVEGLGAVSARRPRLAAALGLALVAGGLAAQARDRASRSATADNIAWNGYEIGLFLKEVFGAHDPLVAVGAAGALPYASGARVIDLFGLTDRHIASTGIHPKRLAHPNLGDPAYVLDRAPDILQFHTLRGTPTLSGPMGASLGADPRTARDYRPVRFHVSRALETFLWVRVESDKIGVRRTEERVELPGHLLGVGSRSAVVRTPDGSTAARCGRDRPTRSISFELPRGRWAVEVASTGRRGLATLGGRAPPRQDLDGTYLHRGGRLRVVVSCEDGPTLVKGVTLARAGHGRSRP